MKKKTSYFLLTIILITQVTHAQELLREKNNAEYLCVPVKFIADFETENNLGFGPNEYLVDGKDHIEPDITITNTESKVNAKSLKMECGDVAVWGSSFFMKSQKDIVLGSGEGVGVWLKSSNDVTVSFHFKDANGTQFFVPKELVEGGEDWAYSYAMPDSYRKANESPQTINPNVTAPFQFMGISIFTQNENVSIFVDGLAVVKELAFDDPASVSIMPNKLANIYNKGESITCYATSSSDIIKLELKDYHGEIVEEKIADKSLSWILPTEKLGHYNLHILSYKDEVADENLVDSRLFSYGVIDGEVGLNSKLGITNHVRRYYYSPKYVDLMSLMGIGYSRIGLLKEFAEQEDGSYEINEFTTNMINLAKEKGIRFICILNDKTPPVTEQLEGEFLEFCEFVLDNYGDFIDQIELWNEWSHATGTYTQYKDQQTAANYVKLLSGIYPELKDKYPNITFIGLGGENPQAYKENIIEMYQAGIAPHMDAISLHPYRQPMLPENRSVKVHNLSMAEQVDEIIDLSKSYEGPEKVYITEIGYPTHRLDWGISDKALAQYMVKTIGYMLTTKGVEQVDWYNLYNEDEMGARGNYEKPEEDPQLHFGLFNGSEFNFAVKPVAMAFRIFSKMTYGLKGITQYDNGEGFCKLTFADDQQNELNILWDNEGEQEIQVSKADQIVYDLMGNEIPNEGTILLSKEPVYVISKKLISSASTGLIENDESLKIYPNPTAGAFNVEIPDFSHRNKYSLEIHNLQGTLVKKQKIDSPITSVNMDQQPSGAYFINLLGEKLLPGKKLIKQ